jgi:hypothetical protein
MCNPISNKSNLHYKAFKGIHISTNKLYYLCDFYLCNEKQFYLVAIETNQKNRSEHQFLQNPSSLQWECSNPDDLPCELIQKIIAQIMTINPL